jgi:hypothetical protein
MTSTTRGCGTRIVGGVYAETRMALPGEKGVPIEAFLMCPPEAVNPGAAGVTPMGVQYVKDDRTGIVHVVDWVGAGHYPNVADFIEEARQHGISRRLPANDRLSLLGPGSTMILLHERAVMKDPAPYLDATHVDRRGRSCPKQIARHSPAFPAQSTGGGLAEHERDVMCARLWWEDIEDGEPILDPSVPYRAVTRTIGSTTYRARRTPDELLDKVGRRVEADEDRYHVGIFARVPIHNLAVIEGQDGEHEEALESAQLSTLDVRLETE